MYCFSIWGDPEEMGLGAKGAPAAADVEGGAPGAPDTMQPKMSKVRSEAVHGTEVAEKKASAMNMCGSLSHVMADSIRSLTAVCVGIAASGWKRKVNGARADAIGALLCGNQPTRYRAGVASMAWRTTRTRHKILISTQALSSAPPPSSSS